MEPRAQRLLELDKILTRLHDAAACALGQARVRDLGPTHDLREARRRLSETSEARRFLQQGKAPPFGGIGDVGAALHSARIGSMLEPRALVAVGAFASGARRLRECLNSVARAEFPILRGYSDGITPLPHLEKAIFDAIDEATSEVKDGASLRLRKARVNIRRTQSDIQQRLRNMLSDTALQPLLQDLFVTVRDGRYCVPVKAECRARVPGIVHDRSGSGGAFFVEPQAVVEMNNHLRELLIEEQEAIEEILLFLTAQVAASHDALTAGQNACGRLDFAFAKARLSQAMGAIEPALDDRTPRCGYALLQARHPLIEHCVPNDILLGDGASEVEGAAVGGDFDAMLITGPNTGGKTVVLKTLGLLCLMAACGLHLPVAPNSRLSLPGAVFADIGDEQSIEQSLSTFSSHLKQIIHILDKARAGDLVLLDEIGAGTDPDEGAALAKAVLRALQRRGVRVVATTHYGELKQFAISAERFENASVEFDAQSLRPTYHLRIGVPGASNALDIAARLGMPPELVQRARRYLGRERIEAEAAAQRLEETQREFEQQTAGVQRERGAVERLRADYEAQLARLQAQVEGERATARREAETIVRQAQQEADAILRDLRSAARESKGTEEARHRLRTLRERVAVEKKTQLAPAASSAPRRDSELGEAPPTPETPSLPPPVVGDMVRVASLDREGVLLSEPGDSGRVTVRIGALKVEVAASDVQAIAQPKSTVGGVAAIRLRKAVTVPEELNLIGKTVDEALPELEKYIDDALLAEVESVRIVHGRGTGTLRAAVHRWLKGHRGVREFHLAPPNEGGEGATIVRFD